MIGAFAYPRDVSIGKRLLIHGGDSLSPGKQVIDMLQAAKAHQRLEFVHLGVGTDIHTLCLGFDGEIAELEELFLDGGLLKDKQSAFTGMEEFGGMEGEHRHIATKADGALVISHPKRMRRIVDDGDAIFLGETSEAIDVTDIAIDMNRDNGFGTRCDQLLNFLGV